MRTRLHADYELLRSLFGLKSLYSSKSAKDGVPSSFDLFVGITFVQTLACFLLFSWSVLDHYHVVFYGYFFC